MIIFHSHSLSSTLTRPIVLLKVLMGNLKEAHNVWSWHKMDGKLSCWCLSSCAYSCGVAFSSKEVSWVLRCTKNILYSRKSQGARLLQGAILCVKLASSSTIYGNIWHPKRRQKGNVSKSLRGNLSWFTQSTSVNLKVEFDNPIQGLQLWVVSEVCHVDYCHVDPLFKSNCRFTALIWTPWMNESNMRWWNWTSSGLFWVVLVAQVMLLGRLST